MRHTFVLMIAFLGGCSSSDFTPAETTDAALADGGCETVTASAACDAYRRAYCERLVRCCTKPDEPSICYAGKACKSSATVNACTLAACLDWQFGAMPACTGDEIAKRPPVCREKVSRCQFDLPTVACSDATGFGLPSTCLEI